MFYLNYNLVTYYITIILFFGNTYLFSMEELPPAQESQELMEPLPKSDLEKDIIKGKIKPITKEDLVNYPNVMSMLPQGYTQALLNFLNGKFIITSKPVAITIDKAEKDIQIRKQLIWGTIAFAHGLYCQSESGYLFIASGQEKLFKGKQTLLTITKWYYERRPQMEKDEMLGNLLQDYKIHLMPKGDMVQDLINFLTFIKNNPQLQPFIQSIKLLWQKDDAALQSITENKEVFPKIVIYVATANGKENTQMLVDAFYKELGNKEGLNIRPRFNEPITSYLYVAQGDGDNKINPNWSQYFEKPYLIYFDKNHPDFIEYFQRKGIDINTVDFHIKNPNPNPPLIEK